MAASTCSLVRFCGDVLEAVSAIVLNGVDGRIKSDHDEVSNWRRVGFGVGCFDAMIVGHEGVVVDRGGFRV